MIEIKAMTPTIGAEIKHVNLNNNLSSAIYDEIYATLIKYKVIFFRDQALTPDAHLALAKSFGDPEPPHPIYPHLEEYENIVLLKSGGNDVPDTNDWHKDMTFKKNPPFASILHGVQVPDVGGDTLFSNMNAAYEALPKQWQEYLEDLEAIHDIGTFRNDLYKKGGIEALNDGLKKTGSAIHKVVDTHPITKLKYLNVNQSFTRNILGQIQGESDRVLQYLYQHCNRPEFQVRFRWENNSVAIWDNRITQHYAVSDYLPKPRHMQRITVLNDKREN